MSERARPAMSSHRVRPCFAKEICPSTHRSIPGVDEWAPGWVRSSPPHHGEFHRTAFRPPAPHDEPVEPPPDVALPPRHGRDVRLHESVAVPLQNLRIAAREKDRRGDGLLGGHAPLLGYLVGHGVHSTPSLARLAKAKGCVQCVEIARCTRLPAPSVQRATPMVRATTYPSPSCVTTPIRAPSSETPPRSPSLAFVTRRGPRAA